MWQYGRAHVRFENPVLQRELLVNLRMQRAFVLLLVYQVSGGAWSTSPGRRNRVWICESPRRRSDWSILFFLGQYMLASLMAPSFAAGTITGEKERKTYEMLLASPLRPGGDRAGQDGRLAGSSGGADFLRRCRS